MTGIETTVRAPAKINWSLRVLGRRHDGYHDIESLVSAVAFYDELIFEVRQDATFELQCDTFEFSTIQSNLIYRAAKLLAERAGCEQGMSCHLIKRIPVGGGLGGGSSNAAATLKVLNRLWSVNWPRERLMSLAGELGSDVPFFLQDTPAIISGRGERIKPIQLRWSGWIVLLVPGFAVSTADVYRAWKAENHRLSEPPDQLAGMDNAVDLMNATFNMLERPAMQLYPDLGTLVEQAVGLARRPVRISGSGSTMFTAFDTPEEAEQFARLVGEELDIETHVVQPVKQV